MARSASRFSDLTAAAPCGASAVPRAVQAALLLGVLLAAAPARADVPGWPSAPYRYAVVDQDLRVVLQEFGRNLGLRVALSDAVQGRVRGRLPELPPEQFLDHLARAFGLDWYFDGSVLSVSASSEAQTRFVKLRGLSVAALRDGLRRAGLLDARFALRAGPSADIAMVSGPPRYVALVEQSAAAIADDRPPPLPAPPPQAASLAASLVVFRGAQASVVRLP